ncbi:helix-turn-helix domain-containing protein [Pyxidicoccus parkwayensis]|nr:helix-turn-helix transcriptional regulator [Pyxidicoccus parkwaysis]
MNFSTRELVLRDTVISALNSSLSFPEVLKAAREPLLEFAQADAAALCLMRVTPSLAFQWHVPGHRIPLLDAGVYESVSHHDFVRGPIFARPNVVIRDEEMLSREEYDHSPLYQHSRDLGMGLDRVMAILLPIGPDYFGAFALYRTSDCAFTDQCATALSSITAHLMNSVRNCGTYQALTTRTRLLDELYSPPDTGFLIVEPPSRVVQRSRRADSLLEKWFTPSDFDSSGLPEVIRTRLNALVRMDADSRLGNDVWVSLEHDAYRVVRFIEMPAPEGPRQWALVMNELPMSIPLPVEMRRKLTPAEANVARHMLRNQSNEQIADELAVSCHTVKTHVKKIFKKLGVDERADFLYQAAHLNKPV